MNALSEGAVIEADRIATGIARRAQAPDRASYPSSCHEGAGGGNVRGGSSPAAASGMDQAITGLGTIGNYLVAFSPHLD